MSCKRMTVLLDRPLLGADGLNLCVVPPGAVEPPLSNVVQVLQCDSGTGTCPQGHNIVQLSQACVGGVSDELFDDLDRVLELLLRHAAGEEGHKSCLLRCCYIQRPRRLDRRWRAGEPEGEILAACAAGRSLVLCADPAAAPQLLVGDEVQEARALFLQAPVFGEAPGAEDFLRKPKHVALEERSSGLEDLELFNEEMQGVARGPDLAPFAQEPQGSREPPGEAPSGAAFAPPERAEPASGAVGAPSAPAASTD